MCSALILSRTRTVFSFMIGFKLQLFYGTSVIQIPRANFFFNYFLGQKKTAKKVAVECGGI